jgi:hypothetical protein
MPAPLLPDPIAAVPAPADIRQMIGIRAAELSLLRRLLRLAESRDRLLPADIIADLIADAAQHRLPLTTADQRLSLNTTEAKGGGRA